MVLPSQLFICWVNKILHFISIFNLFFKAATFPKISPLLVMSKINLFFFAQFFVTDWWFAFQKLEIDCWLPLLSGNAEIFKIVKSFWNILCYFPLISCQFGSILDLSCSYWSRFPIKVFSLWFQKIMLEFFLINIMWPSVT